MKPDSGVEASRSRRDRPPSGAQKSDLLDTIEGQIIPRLLMAHEADPEVSCGGERMPPTDEEVQKVALLAVREQVEEIILCLSTMAAEGLSFDSILLQVIAPAANWLGEAWNEDRLSFHEVTVGAGVLERIAAALGQDSDPPLRHGELIVLTAAPGEQHVVPIHLLGEALRHRGWAVHVDPNMDEEELVELAASDRLATVAFTCKEVERMEGVAEVIASVRAVSLNPHISFAVGGTEALALHATRMGARYCHRIEDFLELIGTPELRESRESSVLPSPMSSAAEED